MLVLAGLGTLRFHKAVTSLLVMAKTFTVDDNLLYTLGVVFLPASVIWLQKGHMKQGVQSLCTVMQV